MMATEFTTAELIARRMDPELITSIKADVDEALENLRYSKDISRDDILPDLNEWEDVRAKLINLMIAAYPRNHDFEPA